MPTADFANALTWYERLFGRRADNRPMEGLAEWRLTDSGWVQLTGDGERAGSGLLNLAVDDLERHVAELADRGLTPGAIQTVTKGVQLSSIEDPDGNTLTFLGGFREEY